MNKPPEGKARKPWRDRLRVHPDAEHFPLMSPDELRALSADIKKNGLRSPAILQLDKNFTPVLLDGRNRLDALALLGDEITLDNSVIFDTISSDIDPFDYVVSANINRRHLTADDKRGIIAKLLKANPQKSDRQIAKLVDASPTTVGDERKKTAASRAASRRISPPRSSAPSRDRKKLNADSRAVRSTPTRQSLSASASPRRACSPRSSTHGTRAMPSQPTMPRASPKMSTRAIGRG